MITIQGTVTDQSSGAKGTPAVSDADMSAWMANLYMQQPIAGHNVNGVPVGLDAISPSGSITHIGDTTSDASGQFAISWEVPQTAGTYTIVATFGGTNSYYSSHSETHLSVLPAPTATPTATKEVTETPFTTYILVAVVILVILALAALILQFRKK